jgi:plastocyanin
MRARVLIMLGFFAQAGVIAADQSVTVGPGISFSSTSVTVAPGETVTWTWADGSFPHSTTSDSQVGAEVWDSGILTTGSFPHTFNTPGDYPFYCKFHSLPASQGGTMMNGVVHVVASTTPSPTPTLTSTPTPSHTPTPSLTPTQTATTTPPTPNSFYALTPCRVIDTRAADAPALAAGGTRTFLVAGTCGMPATARAVSINVTVTQPTAAGDLRLFPGGAPLPLVSTINYRAGQTRANNAIASLGATGNLSVKCDQGSGTVHLVIDVNGYSQ